MPDCKVKLTNRGGDLKDLVCALAEGHDGPVHEASHGERWADPNLDLPSPHDPDASSKGG